jgi:AcrR family transcriptional regulator
VSKQPRGQKTIERVLDAALELYSAGGRDAFMVQALSARSGVSVGSLYHHFGSLAEVARALYRRELLALLERLVAELDYVDDARAGIVAVVRSYLSWTREQRSAARFVHDFAEGGFVPAGDETFASPEGRLLERMLAWLRPFVESGQIVRLPEPLYEMLLLGPVTELARRWLHGNATVDLEQAMLELPERIWQALAQRSTPPPAS